VVVGDRAGRMGRLRIDGARLRFLSDHRNGSNEILAYFETQVER
jgi:hypothetical protein